MQLIGMRSDAGLTFDRPCRCRRWCSSHSLSSMARAPALYNTPVIVNERDPKSPSREVREADYSNVVEAAALSLPWIVRPAVTEDAQLIRSQVERCRLILERMGAEGADPSARRPDSRLALNCSNASEEGLRKRETAVILRSIMSTRWMCHSAARCHRSAIRSGQECPRRQFRRGSDYSAGTLRERPDSIPRSRSGDRHDTRSYGTSIGAFFYDAAPDWDVRQSWSCR